jgi:hypothetical protein
MRLVNIWPVAGDKCGVRQTELPRTGRIAQFIAVDLQIIEKPGALRYVKFEKLSTQAEVMLEPDGSESPFVKFSPLK